MRQDALRDVDVEISVQERINSTYAVVSRALNECHGGFEGAALWRLKAAIQRRCRDYRTALRDIDRVVCNGAAVNAFLEDRASTDVLISFLLSKICYICHEACHLGLLACDCGAHLCHDCVALVVDHFCAPSSAGKRARDHGEVRCGVCKFGTYTLGSMEKHLDCTAFNALVAARDDAKASLVAAATLADERAHAAVAPGPRADIEAGFAVTIARELNTLRCPHCQQAGGRKWGARMHTHTHTPRGIIPHVHYVSAPLS